MIDQTKFSAPEAELINLVINKDDEPLKQKNDYYQQTLLSIIDNLKKASKFPNPESQTAPLIGVWLPLWTTIPFVDIIPGRIGDQSYQIFNENYYANIARYLPVNGINFLKKIFSPAYDLMIIQKYYIENQQWVIENIAVNQNISLANLSSFNQEKAEKWFNKTLKNLEKKNKLNPESVQVKENRFNKKWYKKLQTTAQAKPYFEHIYMSENLRIVKTYREKNQRPSYTIAIRVT